MLNIVKSTTTMFDYKHIASQEEASYIKRKTEELKALDESKERKGKVPGKLVFAMGEILLDIRERLSREHFDTWLTTEAQISEQVSMKYMKVTKVLGGDYSPWLKPGASREWVPKLCNPRAKIF